MGDIAAFKDGQGTAEFNCIECGKLVVSICHHGPPICALCKHAPGWKQDENGKLIPPGEREAEDASDT